MYWIVDVDGTLAIRTERGPFDWSRVGEDLPNLPVIRVIEALWQYGDDLVFVSGRMEQCREQTLNWLREELWLEDIELHMRADDDFRDDTIVKEEIYKEKILPARGKPHGVFDDRNKMVAHWRSLGLACLQVADGDF